MKVAITILVFLLSCTSGNSIRKKSAEICKRVSIPFEAIVDPSQVLEIKGTKFAPARAYNALVHHAIDLVECGKSQSCVIEWTEYERDCAISKSFVDKMLGFSCEIEKPSCKVLVYNSNKD
jgi:hypothetical protein